MSRVLVHVSDLHFGRVDPVLVESLAQVIRTIEPSVLVVSGDLTQRARTAEYVAARDFLDALPFPQVVIPGNHDIPLYNLYGRFVRRLDRFVAYITNDLEPTYIDDELAVFGLNTARSLVWKGGAISPSQMIRLRQRMCVIPRDTMKVVVTHHPLDLPEGFPEGDLLRSARHHFERMVDCGADMLLSGHLHVSRAATGVSRYRVGGHAALFIHAGTATSTRLRGHVNAFNVVRFDGQRVTVEQWSWNPEAAVFAASHVSGFEKTADGWTKGG